MANAKEVKVPHFLEFHFDTKMFSRVICQILKAFSQRMRLNAKDHASYCGIAYCGLVISQQLGTALRVTREFLIFQNDFCFQKVFSQLK